MPFELVPPGTHIDFIGKRRITATISLALLLAGAIGVLGVVLAVTQDEREAALLYALAAAILALRRPVPAAPARQGDPT